MQSLQNDDLERVDRVALDDQVAPEPPVAAVPQQEFPRPLRFRLLLPALLVMLLALILLPFTKQTYYSFMWFTIRLPSGYLDATQQFAAAFGMFSVCLAVWLLDPPRRPALLVLIVALLMGGMVNEAIKQTTGRARPPYSLHLDKGDSEWKWIESYKEKHPQAVMRTQRVDQWLLFSPDRPYFKDGYSSFPSGHSNTAFVLLAFLLVLYPRGRWLWVVLAVGTAAARVAHKRHFPEDVLFGGGLGWLIAQWVFSWAWPYRLGQLAFGDWAHPPANGK